MEGVGGGQRTKETNLNEMTCFGGVKSGELGFSVPSPRQHRSPSLHPRVHQQAQRTDSKSEKDRWRAKKKKE